MIAMRELAMQELARVPEDRLQGVIESIRLACEPSPPYEVTTKEEFYRNIEEGLEDMRQGRVRPYREVFREIKDELKLRIKQS
jgi:predicted transcriptional regulator